MPRAPKTTYQRASFACKNCHAAKVKCDIAKQGFPCSTCVSKGYANCELYESKRRHGRNFELSIAGFKGVREPTPVARVVALPAPPTPNGQVQTQKELQPAPTANGVTANGVIQDVAERHSPKDGDKHSGSDSRPHNEPPRLQQNGSRNNTQHNEAQHNPPAPSPRTQIAAETAYEEIARSMSNRSSDTESRSVHSSSDSQDLGLPYSPRQLMSLGSNLSLMQQPPSRPPSVSALTMDLSLLNGSQGLEFFIEEASHASRGLKSSSALDKNVVTFVGMSSPLSVLLRRLQDTGHVPKNKLSRIQASTVSSSNSMSSPGSSVSSSSLSGSLDEVVPPGKTALGRLPPGSLEDLLTSYFETIHPFYPIINRNWFAEKYSFAIVPPLLLNAVCFAACYHCDSGIIHRAKFESRLEAKRAFYRDAKRLYYEEQEEDLVVVLQASILLSFYSGEPRSAWNCRSWLAIAATIAEDLGIHSSTTNIQMNQSDKSLFKLIWWSLVRRDVMTSSFLGRPQKICDQRCDVDMLTLDDFYAVDQDPDNPIFGKRDITKYHFVIESSKALAILMKVFTARYYPGSDPQPSMKEHALLMDWKKNIPACVTWQSSPQSVASRYLGMMYHHLLMFIFRPRMIDSETSESCRMEDAVASATEVAKLVAKIGVKGTLDIPQDMYNVLVTAMGILLTDYRKHQSEISKLHLQMCMMILSQARDSWDHAWWLMDMFEQMLEGEQSEMAGRTPGDDFDFFAHLP